MIDVGIGLLLRRRTEGELAPESKEINKDGVLLVVGGWLWAVVAGTM